MYALKEVAGALNASGSWEAHQRIMRRVRHWTAMGWLETTGAKYVGTGRSRQYSAESIRKARVLLELARLGTPIPQAAESLFLIGAEYAHLWELAALGEELVYAVYGWSVGLASWGLYAQAPDLSLISDQGGSGEHNPAGTRPPLERPSGAVVLNLTRLFGQLRT